ncbi:hypothetical protein [Spirosoma sp.]|uniref:hypothetical protein n=1 Tax=Spirosoma sp. TaxID=1899569 RepID=UPI0026311C81|nr:hypothetical protein [Spirosoma sp.]MCX6216522.1 hypothetical protein [Spirosoma sp.]
MNDLEEERKYYPIIILILLASAIGYYIQYLRLEKFMEKEKITNAHYAYWDSVRHSVPDGGYIGFLKAESDIQNHYMRYWVDKNTIRYWDSQPPRIYLALKTESLQSPSLIMELDSIDMVYFHKKSVANLDQERKKALTKVNNSFNVVRRVQIWHSEK